VYGEDKMAGDLREEINLQNRKVAHSETMMITRT